MDAQTLFREGVLALRDKHDAALARKLLTESVKLNPDNEMAWLWLSRTTSNADKKREFIERALWINPENEMALALREQLSVADAREAMLDEQPSSRREPPRTTGKQTPAALLSEAERLLECGDTEAAINRWMLILDRQPDHPEAIQNAVRHLHKLGRRDDAWALVKQAIDAGTTSIPIYMTAIDLARLRREQGEADDLRERVALLPGADEALILKMVDDFTELAQPTRAADLLEKALAKHPNSPALLLRMGDLQEHALGRKAQAMLYYDRAARVGGKSRRTAEKAMHSFTPVITDRERGSFLLALREAVGFGAVYLLLGWQDAGLNLLNMGAQRWLGVGLSVIGGYLLVTALSSPQQKPLAAWLGGKVPNPPPALPPPPDSIRLDAEPTASGAVQEPTHIPIILPGMRALFAIVGIVVLVGAFILVFSMSIQLLRQPVQPFVPNVEDLIAVLE